MTAFLYVFYIIYTYIYTNTHTHTHIPQIHKTLVTPFAHNIGGKTKITKWIDNHEWPLCSCIYFFRFIYYIHTFSYFSIFSTSEVLFILRFPLVSEMIYSFCWRPFNIRLEKDLYTYHICTYASYTCIIIYSHYKYELLLPPNADGIPVMVENGRRFCGFFFPSVQ